MVRLLYEWLKIEDQPEETGKAKNQKTKKEAGGKHMAVLCLLQAPEISHVYQKHIN